MSEQKKCPEAADETREVHAKEITALAPHPRHVGPRENKNP